MRVKEPRLLNVNPDFDALDEESKFFADRGIRAARCLGPDTSAACPLLAGEACPKAAGVDLILFQLDLSSPDHRKILRAYRDDHPAKVIAVVSAQEQLWWGSELEGVELIVGPPRISDLGALARRCVRPA